MGVLSDLIIADESDAAAINQARGKHSERWPTLESKGIDTIKLAALASIVVGDQGGSANVSILDQPSPQGPWVILVRRDLVKALADLPPTMHERWPKNGQQVRSFNWTAGTRWRFAITLTN